MDETKTIDPAETDLPCVTLLAHDLEVRRITRRYRTALVVLSIIAAASFAACVASGFRFIY